MGLQFIDILVIILYFILMIGIGIYSRKRTKNQEDFFMGGRRFGKVIQTFAVFGAGTSADSPIGTVRNTYTGGLSGIWTVLNWLFCTPFYWFIGKWYRRMRVMTLGDFYEERYDSRGLAAIYALFALVFFMGYISIGLSAISKTITAISPKSESALTIGERTELSEFNRMRELEEKDYAALSGVEKQELENLHIKNPRGIFPAVNPNTLIYIMGAVTLVYSAVGGITAAYLTDFIQGIMIIFLSVILIPFALTDISNKFGGTGLFDGFTIMHAKVPDEFFEIFGSPHAGDFTWYYVIGIMVMNLIGIIVQPHQMATGGGSAKDELAGRIGLVFGSLLKRFCTLFWALTALLILTLFPGRLSDPDLTWGYATQMLLGPLGMGLVGLMLASLFAALMSSVSSYMISASALIVRNLYKPFAPLKSEKYYVVVGQIVGVTVIAGAIYLSLYFEDIFLQFKFIWELPIIFGASLWVGLFWRRATTAAVWTNVLISALLFFILPATLSSVIPGLPGNEKYLSMTKPAPVVRVYSAKEFDVHEREKEIKNWELLFEEKRLAFPRPTEIMIGDKIEKTIKPEGVSIFWTKGIKIHEDGTREGIGLFNIEMLLYQGFGLDLESLPNPVIETLRLPFKIFLPILIILIVSLFTTPVRNEKMERFFTKMRLMVNPDPNKDKENLEAALRNPESLRHIKLLPESNFEIYKLNKEDVVGFLIICLIVVGIIWLAVGMAEIGA
ncbi:MAG: sodium:solute symporter family protein [Patescibacteria group bacterium]|nr:sodium:solute symporter family protein [Patescibacteria group bacterium]